MDADNRASSNSLEHVPSSQVLAPQIEYSSYTRRDDYGASDFEWQKLFAALYRRRKVGMATLGLFVAFSFLGTWMAPKVYRATTDVLVKPGSSNSMSRLSDTLPVLSSVLQMTQGQSLDTEVEIFKSASVRQDAMKRVPVEYVEELKKSATVRVAPKRDTEVIEVSVSCRDPKAAIAFANAICSAYLDQSQRENSAIYRDTGDYVREQLNDVRRRLDASRLRLRDYKRQNGIVDLSAEGQARISELSRIATDYRAAVAERQSGEVQLSGIRDLIGKMSPTTVASSVVVKRPAVQQLQTQLTTLEGQRLAALQEFTPASPEIKNLDLQIASIRRKLSQEAATEVGSSTTTSNPVRDKLVETASQLQGQNWANESRVRALKQQLDSAQSSLKVLPEREYSLGQLQTEVATLQQTYQALSDKYQTLRISQEAPLSNARIISTSEDALQISPRPLRNLALAIVLGLITSLLVMLAVDRLDDRVYSEEEAWDSTGLSVLAHVPMVARDDNPLIGQGEGSQTSLLESYRMLRTRLAFASVTAPVQSILVTSAQPHEGKSTTATNLAIALALNGKKVILLDADLRRPSIHRIFGIERTEGFTSVLAGLISLEDAIVTTEIENLSVLVAGPTPPNPPELLDSEAVRGLISRLKTMADYLIIDTPPALLLTDPQVVSRMVDGVLLVVSTKDASKRAVAKTAQLLGLTGARMLGIVLTKQNQDESPYYYRYGGYGYSTAKAYSHYLESPPQEDEKG